MSIANFSIYGLYEYYAAARLVTCDPGGRTGLIHRTMYFPHQSDDEISGIIAGYDRLVILVQQPERTIVELFQHDIQSRLHAAGKPYVVISCMDDATFPAEVAESVTKTCSPLFRHWFAVNIDGYGYGYGGVATPPSTHKNITGIPYGVDLWTLASRSMWANTPMSSAYTQDRHLTRLRESAVHFSKRAAAAAASSSPTIYINFQFNIDGDGCAERLEAFHTIPRDLMSIEVSPVNRYDTWGAYTQHAFVASPRGNGLDTIRTWEALMLGCIVIVRRIPGAPAIEELYTDLPVVVVDRWSDISRDFLDQILSEYSLRSFNYKKLTTEYWICRIDNAFDDARI